MNRSDESFAARLDDELVGLSRTEPPDDIDKLALAVLVLDGGGQLRSWNALAQEMLGQTGLADLVASRNVYVAGTDRPYPVDRHPIMRALEGEAMSADDLEIRLSDGGRLTLEVWATSIVSEKGTPSLVTAAFTDTARRRSRDEAFRSVLASANDAYVSIDETSTIIDWNPQAERTFGWSRDEAVGRKLVETIIPPRSRIAHSRGLERYVETGEGPVLYKTVELEALDRQGREFPVELTIWPTGVAADVRFHAFLRDISERKRAEAANRRLAAIVESSYDAIFSLRPTDEAIAITSWNLSAERLCDYSAAEIIGRSVLTLVPPDLEAEMLAILERVLAGESIDHYETELIRHDGKLVPVALTISPIHSETGKAVVGGSVVARDLTERARAEAAEQAARERELEAKSLRHLNETKDAFVTAFSHELRTPLQSILGFVKVLKKRSDQLPPQFLEMADALDTSAQRLDRLMRDVMDVDRVRRGVIYARRVPTDVGEVTGRVVAMADRGTHHIHLETQHMVAEIDPALLERIIEHLFMNALKYTPSGANVWIRNVKSPDGVLLTVEDDGPGVAPDVKDRLFDPFDHGIMHEHAPGLGIGLAVVHRFAELHGGRAWVADRIGGGASFNVLLPETTVEQTTPENSPHPDCGG